MCQARHTTSVSVAVAGPLRQSPPSGSWQQALPPRCLPQDGLSLPTFRSLLRHIQCRPLATRQCSSVSAPRQRRPGAGNIWQACITHGGIARAYGVAWLRAQGQLLRPGDARPPEAGLPCCRRAASGRIPVSTAVIKFESSDSETI